MYFCTVKLNSQCQLHSVAGEHIIIQPATTAGEELQVIAFNDTAKMLWESLSQQEFELADVAALLQQHYDIDGDTATRDAQAWIDTLVAHNLLLNK